VKRYRAGSSSWMGISCTDKPSGFVIQDIEACLRMSEVIVDRPCLGESLFVK
jgi:hypothetical protein